MFKIFQSNQQKWTAQLLHEQEGERRTAANELIKLLYMAWKNSISNYLVKNGATPEDAEDIFHESLVIFVGKVAAGEFKGQGNPLTYLTGICRNQFLKLIERRKRHAEILANLSADDDMQDGEWASLVNKILTDALGKLTSNCQKVLGLYYRDGHSMKEVAAIMDYKLDSTARTTASECRKRLRTLVRANPDIFKY